MRYRIINKLTREKILSSDEFREMKSFTYKDIVDGMCSLDSIGGLVRGTPHRFLCLVQKMEAISLKPAVVVGALEDLRPEGSEGEVCEDKKIETAVDGLKGNVCLIAAFLLYLRLSDGFDKYKSLMRSFLLDFRKIPLVDEHNSRTFVYMDVFVDDLLNKNRMLNVHLNRAPH